MTEKRIHAVTGAFGYGGKYITEKLLEEGHKVITITNSMKGKNPFGKVIIVFNQFTLTTSPTSPLEIVFCRNLR